MSRLAWAACVSARGPRLAERSRPRPTLSASRLTPTNTLTPTPTRPATRYPRAGPSGGTQLPDTLYLALRMFPQSDASLVDFARKELDRDRTDLAMVYLSEVHDPNTIGLAEVARSVREPKR